MRASGASDGLPDGGAPSSDPFPYASQQKLSNTLAAARNPAAAVAADALPPPFLLGLKSQPLSYPAQSPAVQQ
jgi:hypothetical protein